MGLFKTVFFRRALIMLFLFIDALQSTQLYAADTTITSNQTITVDAATEGVIIGETLSVASGVSISTTLDGNAGISSELAASGITVNNAGDISTSGDNAFGIRVSDGTINNTGTITTTGSAADGIDADTATVNNNGNIITNGASAEGIDVETGNVFNTGVVTTTGAGAEALQVATGNVTNTGIVTTTANRSEGIEVDDGIVINTGSITTNGNDAEGINMGDGNVTNTGTITTLGTDATGIEVDTGSITNSGAISVGINAHAIDFDNGTNTLTLQENTHIIGSISLGDDSDTVNLASGENWLITFDNTDGNAIVESFTTENAISATLNGGTTLATYDTAESTRGLEDELYYDLTQGVRSGISNELGDPTKPIANDPSFWIHGMISNRQRNTQATRSNTIVIGGDKLIADNKRLGFLMGTARNRIDANNDTNAERYDANTFYVGLYGRQHYDHLFLDYTTILGKNKNDTQRTVVNNLASTGFDTVAGIYDGYFFDTSATLGKAITINNKTSVASLTLGYIGLFNDDLQETGSTATLQTSNSKTQALYGAAQIKRFAQWQTNNGKHVKASAKTGATFRSAIGNSHVEGVFANTTAFDIDFNDNKDAVGAFIGANVQYELGKNTAFVTSVDVSKENHSDHTVTGYVGIKARF